MAKRPTLVSGDSHVAEIERTYEDIDPKFRDQRPRAVYDEERGALFEVTGLTVPLKVPMGLVCTAGRPREEFDKPIRWEELHPACHDGKARLAIQDEESVRAEVIYPSMGMVLCNHPDVDYRKACFDAYNRWLAAFCEPDPHRLIGLPILGLRSVEEGIEELQAAKDVGARGVMLSGNPAYSDYDDPDYDPFWKACVALGLPVSFHILTTRGDISGSQRGHAILRNMLTIRGNQDIMGMLIFGAVFARNPELKVVCVEADAGWVPHFKYRMDHVFETHRFNEKAGTKSSVPQHRYDERQGKLDRKPSEYFDENIYVTFQDDYSVQYALPGMNPERVLWATDFPHNDGTYPNSIAVGDELIEAIDDASASEAILGRNTIELYGLSHLSTETA